MIYVQPELHRAMKQVALDEGWFVSEAYAEAARHFLAARGVPVEPGPEPAATPQAPPVATLCDLVEAIELQGRRIEEALATAATMRGGALEGSQAPAGTKAAEAMRVVLEILKEAGDTGLSGSELSRRACRTGVRSSAVESAKAVLRTAGIVRREDNRWFLDGIV